MCGITVFLSKNNKDVIVDILKSLSIIQNRGYDSVGIALKLELNWEIYKHASITTSNALEFLIGSMNDKSSNMALGHTRWATHGAKNETNSHPHISMNKNIILVHNGIINNFLDIKKYLIKKNFKFYSETDTEVIANLIEFYLMENYPIERAIGLACGELSGTWALAIVYTKDPNKIFITRFGSPLLLGYNDNLVICTSEVYGFAGLIYNYIVIDNHDIIVLSHSGYSSVKNNIYSSKTISNISVPSLSSLYPHWTIKEIHEQPKTILSAVNNGARILDNEIVLGGLNCMGDILKHIDHVIILGCGTSYHASLLGKIYFDNFITVQAFDASEFVKANLPKSGKILCVVCSQSGETHDLLKCINICKIAGCLLLGIINVVDSLIARSVDCGIYLNAGPEVGVASTKSFTSMLIVLSLLAMWFREKYGNMKIINVLRSLPDTIENLLINNVFKNRCQDIVKFINLNKIQSIFILGRDRLFPVSLEIALKLKELCYIHAEGYSAGSLKHGPFALLDKRALVFLLMDENNSSILTSTFYEISSRDTHCFIITDNNTSDITKLTNNILILPKLKYYQEIIFSIALQYLSYMLSISKNINPDKPRNLAKVVTVE